MTAAADDEVWGRDGLRAGTGSAESPCRRLESERPGGKWVLPNRNGLGVRTNIPCCQAARIPIAEALPHEQHDEPGTR